MDGPDYPIEHFSLMRDLAVELKSVDAQVLRHAYSYEGFGSWWMTIEHEGEVFRLVFDGRDDLYSIEQATTRKEPYQWREPVWCLSGTTHELPLSAILLVLRDAAKLSSK